MSNPMLIKNYDAGAAIEPHRIVKFDSSDFTVIQAAAATDALIGVLADPKQVASGKRADVIHAGIADVELGGTVTRGDPVTSDADGKGVQASPAAGANNDIVGRALKSGVSGDIVPVLVSVGLMQGA